MEGSFKINFDGAVKGNLSPVGFGGVIKNSEGKVLSVFWDSIGTNANNSVKLEGLINGITWSLKYQQIPFIVEGHSLVITNISNRLQHGAAIFWVSRNWRWEGRLTELKIMLTGTLTIQFSHVRRDGNMVADALANEGVRRRKSFHAEKNNDKMDCMLWRRCEELAKKELVKMASNHPRHVQDLPHMLADRYNEINALIKQANTSLHMRNNHIVAKEAHARHVIRIDDDPPLNSTKGNEGIEEENNPPSITLRYDDYKVKMSGSSTKKPKVYGDTQD